MQISLQIWMLNRCLEGDTRQAARQHAINFWPCLRNLGLFLRAHAPLSLIASWFSVKTLFASSIEQHWELRNRPNCEGFTTSLEGLCWRLDHVWLYGISSFWSRRDYRLLLHIQPCVHAAGAAPGFGSQLFRADRNALAAAPVLAM